MCKRHDPTLLIGVICLTVILGAIGFVAGFSLGSQHAGLDQPAAQTRQLR